jgi:hypothetical protein
MSASITVHLMTWSIEDPFLSSDGLDILHRLLCFGPMPPGTKVTVLSVSQLAG